MKIFMALVALAFGVGFVFGAYMIHPGLAVMVVCGSLFSLAAAVATSL